VEKAGLDGWKEPTGDARGSIPTKCRRSVTPSSFAWRAKKKKGGTTGTMCDALGMALEESVAHRGESQAQDSR